MPFPDEYVLEVGQRRVVFRYKGHERVVFSFVHFCVSVLVISFCLRKRPLRDVFLQLQLGNLYSLGVLKKIPHVPFKSDFRGICS